MLCFYRRDLYLDGNFLECEGVIELIKLFADTAEMEAIERAERNETDFAETNSLAVPGVPSAMSSVSRPTSSVALKSKPVRYVQHTHIFSVKNENEKQAWTVTDLTAGQSSLQFPAVIIVFLFPSQ